MKNSSYFRSFERCLKHTSNEKRLNDVAISLQLLRVTKRRHVGQLTSNDLIIQALPWTRTFNFDKLYPDLRFSEIYLFFLKEKEKNVSTISEQPSFI